MSYLNSGQRDAVEITNGPLMILAGAGSGKTRTLVSKISYLIQEKKISPFRILTLTFSNKAAREMRERVASESAFDIGALQITTFHSFCARVLRNEFNYIGLSKNFTIYDDIESRALVKKLLARRGISPKEFSPYEIMGYISDIKNQGFYSGKEFIDDCCIDNKNRCYPYYQEYEAELHQANAIDFGGLITGVLQLLENYPEVIERYQKRFEYILVDEYQDTNRAQFQLLKLLGQLKRNICVVGDEDQSIYSWRGADIRNILDFEKVFSDAKLVKLEQNYRSSKTIIEAAGHVISRNQDRKDKTMWTENSEGDDIQIIECLDDQREGEFISNEISRIIDGGGEWRDIAVFYRNTSQSRVIEDHLRREGVPYRVVAGIKFYERKEVKDMLSYMKVVLNPKDSLAISRIINVPTRGVGVTTLRKLEEVSLQKGVSLWETMQDIVDSPDNHQSLRLSSRIQSSLGQFCHLINECILLNSNKEPPSFIYDKLLRESDFIEALTANKNHESLVRIENLHELHNAIKQFEERREGPTLSEYLETITLDDERENEVSLGGEVSLMTIHGSKGLEFSYVFVSGVEENIFPSARSLHENQDSLEEERRLFYVAMTRAMKKLYISFAQGRMLFGRMAFNGPSRFIDEIPKKYYSWNTIMDGSFPHRYRGNNRKSTKKDAMVDSIDYDIEYSQIPDSEARGRSLKKKKSYCTYPDGANVVHSLYGEGQVLESQGRGAEEKVIIQFFGGGRKKFLVKFAPIVLV